MPPELSESWIALCASASQLGAVLEAIDWVEAIVDSNVLPAVLAAGWLAGLVAVDVVEGSVELVDEPDENGVGNPEKLGMDDTGIATAAEQRSHPASQIAVCC
jgi:hypothetical protein